MLKSQELFDTILSDLIKIQDEMNLASHSANSLRDAVSQMKLIVPVVGEFSAGKSSLLNHFMGKNVLSVSIKAETAIPAELYYSEEEYYEGVSVSGEIKKIESIENKDISDFVYVRCYINSQFLKTIQPLVLVDMPGFDSPLDVHNKAIFNYLDKGTHYVVLTPVDAGTVSRSMIKQIQNIQAFGREATFFISKTDLRSSEECLEVRSLVEENLSEIIGKKVFVNLVNNSDISGFRSFIESLNPDELFRSLFLESIRVECHNTKDALIMQKAALSKTSSENNALIDEIQNAIKNIEEKRDRLIREEKSKSFIDESEMISNAVGSAINAELEALTEIAMSGGADALGAEINNIIQNVVTAKMNVILSNMTARLTTEFSGCMDGLESLMQRYNISDYLGKLKDSVQNFYDSKRSVLNAYIQKRKLKTGTGTSYRAVTSLLSVATNIISPILEVLIIMLPDLIELIFGQVRNKAQKQKVKDTIISQIPVVKRQVKSKVVEVLKGNSENIVEAIAAQYDEELKRKVSEIEVIQKAMQEKSFAASSQAELFTEKIVDVDKLINQLN